MPNLNEIIRTDRDTFDSIVDGTHATETYDDNSVYQIELDEPVELGASNSGMVINSDNQLVVNLSASNIPSLDASKITSGTFADARIASASTWNNKSTVSVSQSGTATDEVQYITVNGTEKKLAGNIYTVTIM